MKTLAIDTCSDTLTVALTEGERVLDKKLCPTRTQHSTVLLPYIDEILKSNGLALSDIGLFAVVAGAGSFTGIRVGISTVKAFCYVLGVPAVQVTSLECLAYNGGKGGNALAVTDAKQNKCYVQAFGAGGEETEILVVENAALDGFLRKYPGYRIAASCDIAGLTSLPFTLCADLSVGLAIAASGKTPQPGSALTPVYVRKCQAEEDGV